LLDLLPNDIFDGATPMPSASHGHDNVPAFSLKVAIGTKRRNCDTQGYFRHFSTAMPNETQELN
jgi:hypothetical protein